MCAITIKVLLVLVSSCMAASLAASAKERANKSSRMPQDLSKISGIQTRASAKGKDRMVIVGQEIFLQDFHHFRKGNVSNNVQREGSPGDLRTGVSGGRPVTENSVARRGGVVMEDGQQVEPALEAKFESMKIPKVVVRKEHSRAVTLQDSPNIVTDFEFSDIKCFRTKGKEFFGVSIHIMNGYHIPYIRDRPQDPLTSSECHLERMSSQKDHYQMSVTDLAACGVEQCGENMCLTMVFPRHPALAMANDEVTTITCFPQRSTIQETQSISFSADTLLENRRSSSNVQGGKQEFAVEVGFFRQNLGTTNGVFTKRVNAGGVVQLGEALQLRSVVRGGDGWTYSKLSDVKVWRMRDGYTHKGGHVTLPDATEVITLVDANGCRNPEHKEIADSHPVRDPRNHLLHHFTFRAFLFRGQRANEPLIVTANVQACQEVTDCLRIDCDTAGRSGDPNIRRFRRAPIDPQNVSDRVHNYNTKMTLHVLGLGDNLTSVRDNEMLGEALGKNHCSYTVALVAASTGFVTLLLCTLTFSLVSYTINNRRRRSVQNEEDTDQKEDLPPTPSPGNPTKDCGKYQGKCVKFSQKPLPPPPTGESDQKRFLPPPDSRKNDSAGGRDVCFRGNSLEACNYAHIEDAPFSRGGRDVQEKLKEEDGVYIVYCCSNGKHPKKVNDHRPTSAPSSLREKRRYFRSRVNPHPPGSNEDSEESEIFCSSERHYRPRTVRGVKRSHQHHQKSRGETCGPGTGIRRRLSSIYREVYGHRYRGGSFPSRIPLKNAYGVSNRPRGKINGVMRDNDSSSDGVAQSSDLDSAYFGSGLSHKQTDNGRNRKDDNFFRGNRLEPSAGANPSKLEEYRNKTSTKVPQEIVFPETNV